MQAGDIDNTLGDEGFPLPELPLSGIDLDTVTHIRQHRSMTQHVWNLEVLIFIN